MGGILSKKTHDFNQELPLKAAVAADLTDKTDLTDISFKAGFQSLSLDTVIEIIGLPLETNEEAMKMMMECKKHKWKDKNLSQALQDYFTITSNLLLWRIKKEEQNDNGKMKIALEGFIQKSHSLEQQLRAHYTKIGPKKRKYRILQFVASIFAIMPVIGPLNLSLIPTGLNLDTLILGLLSLGFVVIGGIGSTTVWFCNRKKNALGVQEEVIGPVLMSMAFRNKDLNHINHLLNEGLSMQNHDQFYATIGNFEERLRRDRNLIQQKLSEQRESASPAWSIRSIDWDAVDNSERTMYQ